MHILNGYFLSVSRSSFHAFYLTVLQKKMFFFFNFVNSKWVCKFQKLIETYLKFRHREASLFQGQYEQVRIESNAGSQMQIIVSIAQNVLTF